MENQKTVYEVLETIGNDNKNLGKVSVACGLSHATLNTSVRRQSGIFNGIHKAIEFGGGKLIYIDKKGNLTELKLVEQ